MYKIYENLINSLEPNLSPSTWYLIDWQFPFGKEINDGELIQLPIKSEIVEIGETKTKFPAQFLDVVERTGMGKKSQRTANKQFATMAGKRLRLTEK